MGISTKAASAKAKHLNGSLVENLRQTLLRMEKADNTSKFSVATLALGLKISMQELNDILLGKEPMSIEQYFYFHAYMETRPSLHLNAIENNMAWAGSDDKWEKESGKT